MVLLALWGAGRSGAWNDRETPSAARLRPSDRRLCRWAVRYRREVRPALPGAVVAQEREHSEDASVIASRGGQLEPLEDAGRGGGADPSAVRRARVGHDRRGRASAAAAADHGERAHLHRDVRNAMFQKVQLRRAIATTSKPSSRPPWPRSPIRPCTTRWGPTRRKRRSQLLWSSTSRWA